MYQHKIGRVGGEGLQSREHRALARRRTADCREQLGVLKPHRRVTVAMGRIDDGQHQGHVVSCQERLQRAGKHGASGERAVLLGTPPHALTRAGGNDDDSDGFVGSHPNALAGQLRSDKPRFRELRDGRI